MSGSLSCAKASEFSTKHVVQRVRNEGDTLHSGKYGQISISQIRRSEIVRIIERQQIDASGLATSSLPCHPRGVGLGVTLPPVIP